MNEEADGCFLFIFMKRESDSKMPLILRKMVCMQHFAQVHNFWHVIALAGKSLKSTIDVLYVLKRKQTHDIGIFTVLDENCVQVYNSLKLKNWHKN